LNNRPQKVIFVARYKARGNFGNKQAYIDNVKPKGISYIGKTHKILGICTLDEIKAPVKRG
jgi:hypothetical protein